MLNSESNIEHYLSGLFVINPIFAATSSSGRRRHLFPNGQYQNWRTSSYGYSYYVPSIEWMAWKDSNCFTHTIRNEQIKEATTEYDKASVWPDENDVFNPAAQYIYADCRDIFPINPSSSRPCSKKASNFREQPYFVSDEENFLSLIFSRDIYSKSNWITLSEPSSCLDFHPWSLHSTCRWGRTYVTNKPVVLDADATQVLLGAPPFPVGMCDANAMYRLQKY